MSTNAFDHATRWAVEGLARSWRLTVSGEGGVRAARERGRRIAFAVWHAALLVPLWHRRREGITLLVSQHGDAAKLAHAGESWGYTIVRGSTTRGGVGGTKGLVRAVRNGRDIATTPDGPRGPARLAKAGLAWVAARAGALVIPIGVRTDRHWRLPSWDGFRIPQVAARVHLHYGSPLALEGVEAAEAAAMLTAALNRAEDNACMP